MVPTPMGTGNDTFVLDAASVVYTVRFTRAENPYTPVYTTNGPLTIISFIFIALSHSKLWIADCSMQFRYILFPFRSRDSIRSGIARGSGGKFMHTIAWWPTLAALAVAVVTDLRRRIIPNWLVFPFLSAGLAVSGFIGGWHGIGQSFLGVGLGLLLFGILFWMGGMGAGDVKLAAAIGAWVGPGQLFFALFVTAIVGGLMALGWAVAGGFVPDLFKGSGNLLFGRKKGETEPAEELKLSNPKTRKMPYAPAIALGTLISFFAR